MRGCDDDVSQCYRRYDVNTLISNAGSVYQEARVRAVVHYPIFYTREVVAVDAQRLI